MVESSQSWLLTKNTTFAVAAGEGVALESRLPHGAARLKRDVEVVEQAVLDRHAADVLAIYYAKMLLRNVLQY